jgi:importin subunit beta-1
MVFLAGCFRDEEKTDSFVTSLLGLIGDFGDTYKGQVRDDLMQEWIQEAIQYGRQRGASKSARNNSQYAQKVSCFETV